MARSSGRPKWPNGSVCHIRFATKVGQRQQEVERTSYVPVSTPEKIASFHYATECPGADGKIQFAVTSVFPQWGEVVTSKELKFRELRP